jgi:hypothetical protein
MQTDTFNRSNSLQAPVEGVLPLLREVSRDTPIIVVRARVVVEFNFRSHNLLP